MMMMLVMDIDNGYGLPHLCRASGLWVPLYHCCADCN
jgi:hypothetical protein